MSETNEAIALLPHDQLVAKMAKDIYFGNGKPALTVRVALQEEAMETTKADIREIKDGQKTFNKLLIGTLISSLGGLIMIGLEIYLHSGK